MSTTRRTAAEQKFWDAAFLLAFPACLKQLDPKESIGCAHVARQQADDALAERGKSERGEQ